MARSGTLGVCRTPCKLTTALRSWLSALACALALVPSLDAQRAWSGSFYPYAYYSTVDAFWFAAHYGLTSAIGFKERPEENAGAVNFDVGGSTEGSYSFVADAHLPALWDGWRVRLTLAAARDNRLGFYGLGNDAPYAADSVTVDAPHFYQVSRTHPSARVTVQRRLVGPLRLLAGAGITRTDFHALPGPTLFGQDSTYERFTDKTVRAGLVVDTRDNELNPHSGIVAEGLFASGPGYTRTTVSTRVYARPLKRLVVAARLAGEGTGGSPPFAAQVEMESSERPFIAAGGYQSLRGYYDARFVGPGKLLGGLELRYTPVMSPSVFELVIAGFYDTGRVFGPEESFRLTTDGLHSSGGVEVAARFLRNSLLVVGVGACSEGAQLLFGTQWSY